jgi:hypothetical protein
MDRVWPTGLLLATPDIDGVWAVIFTKLVMFCFTRLTCVFDGLSIFIA